MFAHDSTLKQYHDTLLVLSKDGSSEMSSLKPSKKAHHRPTHPEK
ncbi:MAG: hypothetical protein P4L99_26380 [Chthoniobacter sp.]|nr:hypothetical protein [Chthoniobacter sp.]